MAARRLLLSLACLTLTAACTPAPQPKQLPPQTVTQTPAPPPPSDPPPPAPERPSTVVVVDHGGEETPPPQTLADAARAEKERRQTVGKPTVVINDKNLAEYAAKGQITTAKPAPSATAPATGPTAAPANPQNEEYWRKRGLEIRQRWHDAAEESKKQQAAVDRLRTQFYSEDDPYVRDGRIKPEWDRALDKLDQARREIENAKRDLDAFTEEGYRAGALQAWLEEGIDLEPPHPPVKKDKPSEPGEPKILQEGTREPSSPPPA